VAVADRLDPLTEWFLVGIGGDEALPEEVLTRKLGNLNLRAGPELLPRLVQPPQVPRQPAARPFEERAAQARMALEHAAGGHAAEGHHQLDGIAAGHPDHAAVRRVEVSPGDVVVERG